MMELPEADLYYRSMTALEAQEMLTQLRVQDWSHMKDESRNKMWSQLSQTAYPDAQPENKKEVSNSEIASWIMGALGG